MFSHINARKLLVLLTLAMCFWAVLPLESQAQSPNAGPGASSDKHDSNKGTASDIREDFYKRMKNAKSFSPRKYGGEDVVIDGESIGPGKVKHNLTGPVQVWPVPIKDAVSIVPTLRDQGIQRNPLITFGMPISDTQYQILHRYDQNIMLEQLFDPEKVIWVINAMGMVQTQSAANSAANLERNQASTAIEYSEKYLPNFTTQKGNRWNTIRDKLFVPMAILLLLPGAVLAQIKAIIAQGSNLFGDVNPFDGIIRSIVAIFFIPATYLVVNYGIDVSNSISLTIRDNYQRVFGSNMYKDAECAEKRAFPIRPKDSNDNGIFRSTEPKAKGAGDLPAFTDHEKAYDIVGKDPCKDGGGGANDLADETTPVLMNISRVAVNIANVGLAGTWNVMCAFQVAYLHYLFLMGPIVAALWVWPIESFRKALGSWVEGVLVICFWSLFWNTTILLMACFRNVCTTGTVIMTALNLLAVYCVQHAFNFLQLASAAGQHAAGAAQEAGAAAAGHAAAVGAKSGVGAQGGAISGAHAPPNAPPGAAPGAQPGAGAGTAGGAGGMAQPGAPLITGAGQGTALAGQGHGTASGGGSGAGGASSFSGGQGSPVSSGPAGAGPHVSPPPGQAHGGSGLNPAGGAGAAASQGASVGAPPSFGAASQGAGGAAGHGGASGAAGQGGSGGIGGSGAAGNQAPGIQGHSGLSGGQAAPGQGHGQAAGINPPPGQGMSTDAHMHGGNLQSNNLSGQQGHPPGANLHQGTGNAGLGAHEGLHGGPIGQNMGGPLDAGGGMPPLSGGAPLISDASGVMQSGFTDTTYTQPPMMDQSSIPTFTDVAAPPPQDVVQTNWDVQSAPAPETQYITQETQMQQPGETQVVMQETQVQQPGETQIITNEVQSQNPLERQEYVQLEASNNVAYNEPQGPPPGSGGVEYENRTVETTNITNETNIASSQTGVNQNPTQQGGVQPGGLQTNVNAAGLGSGQGAQGQPSSGLVPPAMPGGSSILGRALGQAQPQTRKAEFTGPVHYGSQTDEEGLLSSLPPAAAPGGGGGGGGGDNIKSTPDDHQPEKPRSSQEDDSENA